MDRKVIEHDQLVVNIPKQLVYSFENVDCKEGQMVILVDGKVIEPVMVSSKTMNIITLDVQKGTHQPGSTISIVLLQLGVVSFIIS